jgi:L-threonine kinase
MLSSSPSSQPVEMADRAATAEVPCTCGELVQGALDGRPFLVSCPIDRYSRVTVRLGTQDNARDAATGNGAGQPCGFSLEHPMGDKPPAKAMRAAEATLEQLGMGGTAFHLELDCPLSPSRGFGTSTADVVGAIAATAAAARADLTPGQIAQLAVGVEPSDGTMFPGLALLDHRSAEVWEELGTAPPLLLVVLEFAGTVDTLEFNAQLQMERLRPLESEHRQALELLRQGLRENRPDLIGQAATASARANQLLLPKAQLEATIALGEGYGALGVCAAHSGTALGVLFAPNDAQSAEAMQGSASQLPCLEAAWVSRMVGGGARIGKERQDLGGTLRSHQEGATID